MSIIDKLQQTTIEAESTELEGSDDLPELPSILQSPDTSVQVGDIILCNPLKFKWRWPGLVKCKKKRSSKAAKSAGVEAKRNLRSKSLPTEEDFTYSHDVLTVHLLNYPDPLKAQREIKPPSRVEFYLSSKQPKIISEWAKSTHVGYIPSLLKAFEEVETYLRKRSAKTLVPGTAVEQYMQVKRSRLDFDFEGLEHTNQDKHLRFGDISSINLETADNGTTDFLNSCIESSDAESSDHSNMDALEDPKPCLDSQEFVCLTERIRCCKELLRAIYLGKRFSLKHNTYFCNSKQNRKQLKIAYLASFDSIPYSLESSQKTEILDIVLEFANNFVELDPRKEEFSVPSYAYDVLLPECTTWLTIELENYPLIFPNNSFKQTN